MRALLFLLTAVVLAGPSGAQILRVHFTDEKAAKKFKKHTIIIDGEEVLLGEPVEGGGILLTYKDGQLANVSFDLRRFGGAGVVAHKQRGKGRNAARQARKRTVLDCAIKLQLSPRRWW